MPESMSVRESNAIIRLSRELEDAKGQIKELEDALKNMVGVFDTPLGRRQISNEFANEARKVARELLEKRGWSPWISAYTGGEYNEEE